ncbi:MAG: cobalt-precorrin 5A hydrolase [Desulfitobacterium sp.]|nr:cobalt-precorrin 5A hydrolase [Desulfitobacterium sp.]
MTAILALTKEGLKVAMMILNNWETSSDNKPSVYLHESLSDINIDPLIQESKLSFFSKLKDIIPIIWKGSSLLICIMATGIVVRQISPLLKGKDQDPAVLVLDEKGTFVISLLSGHLGGANFWTKKVAQYIGATPVITTATDVQGLIAPDEYAREFGWEVEPLAKLKKVNRFLLDNGYLKVWTNILPENHTMGRDPHYHFVSDEEKDQAQIWILDLVQGKEQYTQLSSNLAEGPLLLIPKIYSLGIGCRKGTPKEQILRAIQEALNRVGISQKGVKGIFSIDLKAQEEGLIEAAHTLGIPFKTFAAEEIQILNEHRNLSASNFVREKIGVNGVCEAASLLGTKEGELILPKQIIQGVTVAISKEKSLW